MFLLSVSVNDFISKDNNNSSKKKIIAAKLILCGYYFYKIPCSLQMRSISDL